MKCRNCGEEITDDMEFCKKCGLHLKYVAQQFTKSEITLQPTLRNPMFYLKIAGIAVIFLVVVMFIMINQ